MITGELKNKIDQLWEMLWTEGNANPLTNIEQLTYLLFMKDLDRVELGRENDAEFQEFPMREFSQRINLNIVGQPLRTQEMRKKFIAWMSQEIFPFIRI